VKIAVTRLREELYQRINTRVDQMINDGLVDEAKALYHRRGLNALNTVGYKEMFNFLDGVWTFEEAIERLKGNTRRYARKQLTWFKKDSQLKWFDLTGHTINEDITNIINYLDSI
jgi:tRNA dimethylallyltransferase